VRQLALGWLLVLGCGSSMHHEETTPADFEVSDDHEEPCSHHVPMPL